RTRWGRPARGAPRGAACGRARAAVRARTCAAPARWGSARGGPPGLLASLASCRVGGPPREEIGVAGLERTGGRQDGKRRIRPLPGSAPWGRAGLAGANVAGSLLPAKGTLGVGVQAASARRARIERPERIRDDDSLAPAVLRRRFADAFAARRELYWIDVLGSAALGWGAFVASGHVRSPLAGGAALAVATLALYRAVLFIHELAHLRTRDVPGLPLAWNLVVGFPLAVPSILYVGTH